MFDDVVTVLRDRPMPVGRDVVMGLLDVFDAAAVALNDALDGFDSAGLWQVERAPSLVAWLKVHGRRSPADASRLCRRMTRLRSCVTSPTAPPSCSPRGKRNGSTPWRACRWSTPRR